jgi:hypothetical protein
MLDCVGFLNNVRLDFWTIEDLDLSSQTAHILLKEDVQISIQCFLSPVIVG